MENRRRERAKEATEAANASLSASQLSSRRNQSHAILYVTGIVLSVLLVWSIIDVLLLVYAGVLAAVFLRGLSNWISGKAGISEKISLTLVTVCSGGSVVVGGWLLAPDVADQIGQMTQQLPNAFSDFKAGLADSSWGRAILGFIPDPAQLPGVLGGLVKRATGFLSTMLGALLGFIIILFLGLYFSINPTYYIGGTIALFPIHRRERVREVLHSVGSTLHWWLIARLLSMGIVGLLTGIGLWLLGVPLALALGILAAILSFIPNIGPVLSAIPAVLLAFNTGHSQALYVILLYFVIQGVESYLITPVIQKRAVSLPPALTLTAQLVAGILMGMPGIILATPLTATLLVLVKSLYIEDVLGNRTQRSNT